MIYCALTGLLLGTNHGRSTTNPNQRVLQCNGNITVHLQPKVLGSEYAINWEGHAYHVLGFSGSIVSPFSEEW
jgi:hypothetical protein